MENSQQTNNSEASLSTATPNQESSQQADGTSTRTGDVGESVKEETFFDPKSVPPELEPAYKQLQAAFTKKTQDIAAVKSKADAFNKLVAYKPFQDWYVSHTNPVAQASPTAYQQTSPQTGEELNLSDEEYQEITSNPRKFAGFIRQVVEDVTQRTVLPVAEEAKAEAAILKKQGEIDEFARQHSDFWDLDEQGLIEPLIVKYPNAEIEDIYRIAKFPSLYQDTVNKVHGMVQDKKGAVVEKPGIGTASGSSKVRIKSREDAMNIAYEAAANNRPVPEFEYEK